MLVNISPALRALMPFRLLQTLNWEPELSMPHQRSSFAAIQKSLRLYILNDTRDYNSNKELLDAIYKKVEVSCNKYDFVKSEIKSNCIQVSEIGMDSNVLNDCCVNPFTINHKAVNVLEICSWFIQCVTAINEEASSPGSSTSDELFNLSHVAISTNEIEDSFSSHPNQTNYDVVMNDVSVSNSQCHYDEGATNSCGNANRLQRLHDMNVPGTLRVIAIRVFGLKT